MAGIAGDENRGNAGGDLLHRHVVELVAKTLADLVYRKPSDVFELNVVWVKDPIRDLDQLLWGDTAAVEHLLVTDLVELDIEPDQVSALTRDDEDVALVCRVDQAFDPDVREVGDSQDVHHAPGFVRHVPGQLAADRGPDAAARAVAADDVPGLDDRGVPSLLQVPHVLQGHPHRVLRRVGGIHLDVARVQAVDRLQPACRTFHVIAQVGEQPRLVDDHMGHL